MHLKMNEIDDTIYENDMKYIIYEIDDIIMLVVISSQKFFLVRTYVTGIKHQLIFRSVTSSIGKTKNCKSNISS